MVWCCTCRSLTTCTLEPKGSVTGGYGLLGALRLGTKTMAGCDAGLEDARPSQPFGHLQGFPLSTSCTTKTVSGKLVASRE